jgi:hypothetical protein
MHVRYMVLISNISESGGLSKLSRAWFPITQKLEPHSRNSSSDSIVLLSPLPPPWAPLDNTAHKTESPVTLYAFYFMQDPLAAIIFRICTFRFLFFFLFVHIRARLYYTRQRIHYTRAHTYTRIIHTYYLIFVSTCRTAFKNVYTILLCVYTG